MGRGRVMGGAVGRPATKAARIRYTNTIKARKKKTEEKQRETI
jgi:hypothetical protein